MNVIQTCLPSAKYRRLSDGVRGIKHSDEPRRMFILDKLRNCICAKQYNKWIVEYNKV